MNGIRTILLVAVALACLAVAYRACSANRLLVDPQAEKEIEKAKQR
jgi:hypothetical protein